MYVPVLSMIEGELGPFVKALTPVHLWWEIIIFILFYLFQGEVARTSAEGIFPVSLFELLPKTFTLKAKNSIKE